MTRIRATVLVGLFAATLAAPAFAAGNLVQQGKAARAEGRYLTAQSLLQQATKAEPRNVEAWRALGDLQSFLGDDAASVRSYQELVRLAPNDLDGQAGLANGFNGIDQYNRAYEIAEKALAQHPSNARVLSKLYLDLAASQGFKAEKEGFFAMIKYGLAVEGNIKKAIAADPTNAEAVYAMGRYFLEAPGAVGGSTTKALQDFHKAYSMDPSYYENRGYYIRALVETHQDAVAKVEYARYMQIFGTLPHAREVVAPVAGKLK